MDCVPIASDTTARTFVRRHHYSHAYPVARRRFALLQDGLIAGIAVFAQPMSDGIFREFDAPAQECLDLGRLVLLDRVGANAETWFLSRCFAALKKEGFAAIVAMSDPQSRTDAQGNVVFKGHVGTIYQALNGRYLGRTTPRTLRLLPNGTVFASRTETKIRDRRKGWRYAALQLIRAGAPPLPADDVPDLGAWLAAATATVTRSLRHAGNHRYGWALRRHIWREDISDLPYPKTLDP